MVEDDWIVQIDFKVQGNYELKKGFIKSIIKDRFNLKKWDGLQQKWWDGLNDLVEVRRIVENEKTVGLKVRGNKELADALVVFCKGVEGAEFQFLSVVNAVDKEVKEIADLESCKYGFYIDRRVERGDKTVEEGERLKKKWRATVMAVEYQRRGVEID